MPDREKIKRYQANLKDEMNAATIYNALADCEKDSKRSEIYRKLAETEQSHASKWAEELREVGGTVPGFRPSWQTRTLVWFARRFGAQSILQTLSATEDSATSHYVDQPEAAEMIPQERSHARMLRQMSMIRPGGVAGAELARLEGRHRAAGGNALRAAVLGASDGLLSNFNLIMGVAGAQLAARTILLTGFAGLLAGAISMALGEYISVQSSRELYQKQLAIEKQEIETVPEEEVEELSLIYQSRGLDKDSAHALASKIMSSRDTALDTLARDELGINPEELGGSAWEAAITSFMLFAAGAIVPVIPYLFLSGTLAVIASAGCSAVALFGIGTAITLFTGRSVWYSGFRQVGFGLAAAAATYGLGHLIGVRVGG